MKHKFENKYEFIESCYDGELSTKITKSYNLQNMDDVNAFLKYVLAKMTEEKLNFHIDSMTLYRYKFRNRNK